MDDNLVDLVGNQDPGRDDGQVLGPAPAHGEPDPLGRLECCVGDGAQCEQVDVAEGADINKTPQQQLHDDAASHIEVQLVFGVVGPVVEPTLAACDQQADCEDYQDG